MLEARAPAGPVVGLTAQMRAPVDKVYAAWTRPELLRKWFFAEAGYRTHDVEVELAELGAYQIVITPTDGGDPTKIHGHFVEVEDGKRLVYTWTGACAQEQYWTLVTATFEASEGGGTSLTLGHGVFRSDADRVMHEQGWLACLTALDAMLDGDAG